MRRNLAGRKLGWKWVATLAVLVGLTSGIGGNPLLRGDEKPVPQDAAPETPATEAPAAEGSPAEAAPNELVRLAEKHDVFLDKKRKAIIVDGVVCLREGQLEMFACPKGSKEHESVIALNCIPEQVHAGLLAVGAKTGTPVTFSPKYAPATGDVIDIFILWRDKDGGKHKARAQEWVQHAKTGKEMEYDWVFAGSGFWEDEETKEKHYQANAGDFICVSNFPTATLDLPVESSQANSSLLFHAFTERIPPKGTKIRMVLIPRKKEAAKEIPKEATEVGKEPAK